MLSFASSLLLAATAVSAVPVPAGFAASNATFSQNGVTVPKAAVTAQKVSVAYNTDGEFYTCDASVPAFADQKLAAIPADVYGDASESDYCGTYIVLENLKNNYSTTALVAGSSNSSELILNHATWWSLYGVHSNLTSLTWRFATDDEADFAALADDDSESASYSASSTEASSSSKSYVADYTTKASSTYSPEYTSKASSTYSPEYTSKASSTYSPEYTTKATTKYTTTEATTSYKPKTTTTTEAKATTTQSSSSGSYSGEATFYTQGGVAGACGSVNSDSAYIVALDSAIYSGGAHCGKTVHITNTANGQSVTARVADECPTCSSAYSLDLSVAAFDAIGDEDTGVLPITWSWA